MFAHFILSTAGLIQLALTGEEAKTHPYNTQYYQTKSIDVKMFYVFIHGMYFTFLTFFFIFTTLFLKSCKMAHTYYKTTN